MPSQDSVFRNLKPKDKPYKFADEKGLFLLVNPSGSKLWRVKYRYEGKERLLAIGACPEVSLKEAREKRDEARSHLKNGRNPSAEKQARKRSGKIETSNSFETVARDFLKTTTRLWSGRHRQNAQNRREQNLFPRLGNRPIAKIGAVELLAEIRKIEARGAHEMAHRVRALCSQIFRYGIACGICDDDPAAKLRGALVSVKPVHMPVIELEELASTPCSH